jgi:hypothetical protein
MEVSEQLHGPDRFTSGAHWIGGWVGSRASLDAGVRRKIPSPYRDSKSRLSSAIPLSYPGVIIILIIISIIIIIIKCLF